MNKRRTVSQRDTACGAYLSDSFLFWLLNLESDLPNQLNVIKFISSYERLSVLAGFFVFDAKRGAVRIIHDCDDCV